MKRVVWVYRDYRNNERYKGKVSLDFEMLCPEETDVLKAALASWIAFAPDYTRVIYLDKSVKDYLEKIRVLKYYDEVYEVDFQKEIDDVYPSINFFAAPKLWVIGQQKEPFIIADTEMVLRTELDRWRQEGTYYSMSYPDTEPISFSNWSSESKNIFFQIRTIADPWYRKFLNPSDMINAGFITWPDPVVAKKVSETALFICDNVCRLDLDFPEKWTLCEESILPSLIRYYSGKSIQKIEFKGLNATCNLLEYSSTGIIPELYQGFLRDIEELQENRLDFQEAYRKVLKGEEIER